MGKSGWLSDGALFPSSLGHTPLPGYNCVSLFLPCGVKGTPLSPHWCSSPVGASGTPCHAPGQPSLCFPEAQRHDMLSGNSRAAPLTVFLFVFPLRTSQPQNPRIAAIPEEKELDFIRQASPEALSFYPMPPSLWVTCPHCSSFPQSNPSSVN